jgi:hypothetical protein
MEHDRWYPWFAWYPVRLLDGTWVWLEKVARCLRHECGRGDCADYWVYDANLVWKGIK